MVLSLLWNVDPKNRCFTSAGAPVTETDCKLTRKLDLAFSGFSGCVLKLKYDQSDFDFDRDCEKILIFIFFKDVDGWGGCFFKRKVSRNRTRNEVEQRPPPLLDFWKILVDFGTMFKQFLDNVDLKWARHVASDDRAGATVHNVLAGDQLNGADLNRAQPGYINQAINLIPVHR